MTSVGLGVEGEKVREGDGKCNETPKNGENKGKRVDGKMGNTETQRKARK